MDFKKLGFLTYIENLMKTEQEINNWFVLNLDDMSNIIHYLKETDFKIYEFSRDASLEECKQYIKSQ